MKELTPKAQLSVLAKNYVSARDLSNLYPIGFGRALKVVKEIVTEIEAEGKRTFNTTRPIMVPISYVLKRYPVDEKRIRRAAQDELEGVFNEDRW